MRTSARAVADTVARPAVEIVVIVVSAVEQDMVAVSFVGHRMVGTVGVALAALVATPAPVETTGMQPVGSVKASSKKGLETWSFALPSVSLLRI
jgi:hypothetical protein